MKFLSVIPNQSKQAIGILSIGTFLEYFDFMLYIHMAILLNEIFFPKTSPETEALLASLTFCSTYLLRPLGAIIFGYIGDNIGRKATVIITTFMMALSCLVMANLPTYSQIGIVATWLVICCRIVQGLSAMGEIMGANIYLTETIKPPYRNSIVASLEIFCELGALCALGVAALATGYGLNWRYAFWVGAIIGLLGFTARTRLKETSEFVNAKKRLTNKLIDLNQSPDLLNNNIIIQEKVSYKLLLSYFTLSGFFAIRLYLTYMFCGSILKTQFNFTSAEVITQNFFVSLVNIFHVVTLVFLSYRVHPLRILKYKLYIFSVFLCLFPYLLTQLQNSYQLFVIQCIIEIFMPTVFPAGVILLKNLPVFRRFTYACLMHALSRTVMSILISFGLVSLIASYGYYSIYVILLPLIIAFYFARSYYEKLERAAGDYY